MPDLTLVQALAQVVELFHRAVVLLVAFVAALQAASVDQDQQLVTNAVGQTIMRAIVRRRL